mgnify:FL=1
MRRRKFLKNGLAGLSMIGLPNIGLNAAIPNSVKTDYKALVCIYLDGGNDAWNTFVPASGSGTSQWDVYANGRGTLKVADSDLTKPTSMSISSVNDNPYYIQNDPNDSESYLLGSYPLTSASISEVKVNALMPELAGLIVDEKASLVGNIGTLVEPLNGKTDFLDSSKKKPSFLFAHNHQTRIIETGKADDLNTTGWAGRLADLWSGINSESVMGLNVSFDGQVRLMTGVNSKPILFNPDHSVSYWDMEKNSSNNVYSSRRDLFATLYGTNPGSDPFRSVYNKMLKGSLDLDELLRTYWTDDQKTTFSSNGSYGESLFAVPTTTQTGLQEDLNGDLIENLEAIAQLIYLGSSSSKMNFNRQIFFVKFGSFDTHGNQAEEHPILLRELSVALWKFQKALIDIGAEDKVVTFTTSDFGRTLGNNGDGTDHAWSSINLLLSDSSIIKGGKFVGDLPDFTMGGDHDIRDGGKGRFVPKLAVEQMLSSICSWFGVPDTDMETLFPNLKKFKSGSSINTAYLDLFQ